jgi:ribosomal protein S18 acetylase RimI-like enzyme
MPSPPDDPIEVRLRRAEIEDRDTLVPLVREYHATEGIAQDPAAYSDILAPLLAGDGHGRLWFVEADRAVVGYVALCFGYSIEFGGRDAFVDEIFVLPACRGRGVGERALALAIEAARGLGVRALHLEVALENHGARRLYARHGFALRERYQLMTRLLT